MITPSARIDELLLAFAVTLPDDSVNVIDGMRRILDCQRAGSFFCGQALLECELGKFLLCSWTCQQSAIYGLVLQGTRESQLTGSEGLRRA